ncbi:transcriptional regulator GcvA [Methyloceanibacter sp.]|uniref:transcriptional regulator GcvA n=1 Tax=Methyloceanibacter sp. TaxID=1965321 RepID=UPI002D3F34F0|nr:transcriptional regulator GcvA [Methyloceanibacter sp.]HZP10683.1 transcriptional regulator GcvA [Methyloceanibacter sp.]
MPPAARRIPPLPGLRAFEAVARLASFRRAAEELAVTKSAVSHQVQALEGYLGVRLLNRGAGRISLTAAGEALLPEVQSALDRLAGVVADLRHRSRTEPLTISLLPTFAVRWLIPRLANFREQHPDIEVRLDASLEAADFDSSGVDVAIRYGRGEWPGLHCERLIVESLTPVCSPALLQGRSPLRQPADLARHVLLHNSAHPDDWPLWLKTVGVRGIDLERGPRFAYSELLLKAAAEGLGVALARRHLIDKDLADGTLVAPFGTVCETGYSYWLVWPRKRHTDRRVASFRKWVLGQLDGRQA